jgi:type IV pilus assembly protein PilE
MYSTLFSPRKESGVTMLELLIVVAIIAIISSYAYPSYMNHVAKTKRTAATSMLLQMADRQQQFFMDNKTYAADLTDLGFSADPFVINDGGVASTDEDLQSVYSISMSNVATTTYTITADPLHGQKVRDANCGSLTLNQAGVRASGGDDCWN